MSQRNLLTGQGHTINGDDSMIAGVDGTLEGNRTVFLNLDGSSRTSTRTGALDVWGDFYHNGSAIGSSFDLSTALDGLGT